MRRSRRSGWGGVLLAALGLALAAPAAAQSPTTDACALGPCRVSRPHTPREPLLYLATALVTVGLLGFREPQRAEDAPDLE